MTEKTRNQTPAGKTISNLTTPTAWPLRAAPEFGPAIASNQWLAMGSVQDRVLILVAVDKRMSSAGKAG